MYPAILSLFSSISLHIAQKHGSRGTEVNHPAPAEERELTPRPIFVPLQHRISTLPAQIWGSHHLYSWVLLLSPGSLPSWAAQYWFLYWLISAAIYIQYFTKCHGKPWWLVGQMWLRTTGFLKPVAWKGMTYLLPCADRFSSGRCWQCRTQAHASARAIKCLNTFAPATRTASVRWQRFFIAERMQKVYMGRKQRSANSWEKNSWRAIECRNSTSGSLRATQWDLGMSVQGNTAVCPAFLLFSKLLIPWSWSHCGYRTWARPAMRPTCVDVLHSPLTSAGVLLWSISACAKLSDSFEVNMTSGCKKPPWGTTDVLFHVSMLSGLHKPQCGGNWEMHQERKHHCIWVGVN